MIEREDSTIQKVEFKMSIDEADQYLKTACFDVSFQIELALGLKIPRLRKALEGNLLLHESVRDLLRATNAAEKVAAKYIRTTRFDDDFQVKLARHLRDHPYFKEALARNQFLITSARSLLRPGGRIGAGVN